MSQARPRGVPTVNGTKDLGVKCLENRIPLEGKKPTSGSIFSFLPVRSNHRSTVSISPGCLRALGRCSACSGPPAALPQTARPSSCEPSRGTKCLPSGSGCLQTNEGSVCLPGHQRGNQCEPGRQPTCRRVSWRPQHTDSQGEGTLGKAYTPRGSTFVQRVVTSEVRTLRVHIGGVSFCTRSPVTTFTLLIARAPGSSTGGAEI